MIEVGLKLHNKSSLIRDRIAAGQQCCNSSGGTIMPVKRRVNCPIIFKSHWLLVEQPAGTR